MSCSKSTPGAAIDGPQQRAFARLLQHLATTSSHSSACADTQGFAGTADRLPVLALVRRQRYATSEQEQISTLPPTAALPRAEYARPANAGIVDDHERALGDQLRGAPSPCGAWSVSPSTISSARAVTTLGAGCAAISSPPAARSPGPRFSRAKQRSGSSEPTGTAARASIWSGRGSSARPLPRNVMPSRVILRQSVVGLMSKGLSRAFAAAVATRAARPPAPSAPTRRRCQPASCPAGALRSGAGPRGKTSSTRDRRRRAERDGLLDQVLELADVARQVVADELSPSRLRRAWRGAFILRLDLSRKCSTRSGMSSRRSRSGGRMKRATFRR